MANLSRSSEPADVELDAAGKAPGAELEARSDEAWERFAQGPAAMTRDEAFHYLCDMLVDLALLAERGGYSKVAELLVEAHREAVRERSQQ